MGTEGRLETVESAILVLSESVVVLQELAVRQQEQLEEMRRDNAMTRRLWVKLAAKYGWEDEDLFHEDT